MADLELILELAREADTPALTLLMERAFDDGPQKHQGQVKGGPPGYNSGEFFRKWLLPYQESIGYKVCTGEAPIGDVR